MSAFAAAGFLVIGLLATFSLGGAHRPRESEEEAAAADPNLLSKDNELS